MAIMNSKQRRKAYRAMPQDGQHFAYLSAAGFVRHAVSYGPYQSEPGRCGDERANVKNPNRVKACLWTEEDCDYPSGGIVHPVVSRIIRVLPLRTAA